MSTRATFLAGIAATAIVVSACSSAATPVPTPEPTAPPAASEEASPSAATSEAPASGSPAASGLGVTSFDSAFTAMSQLTGVTTAGTGLVGVILPDTTSSSRYVDFDLPYLTKAFTTAGYATTDFKIDNAGGVDATQLSMAQADITAGAKVLLVDPIDGTVGNQIQTAAAAAGVTMISYDRATFQGTNTYYVSFDNVQVGKLIGQGLMDCVTAWGVTNPQVFELDGGEDTDPNAISFAAGYNNVIWGTDLTTPPPSAPGPPTRPATRSSATRSPRAGTTPRAVRSSPRHTRRTRRSMPPSRPTTAWPMPSSRR